VAAQFGGGKVVGVAPNAGIAGCNVFEPIPDCGACAYDFPRWQAMINAASLDFKVINTSLGGYGFHGGPGTNELTTFLAADKRVTDLVTNMGTTVVVSAGNGGVNLNGPIVHVPGDSPGVINTGATGIRPNC
jgi:lantibiotic leader peptide-processing serine protease